MQAKTPIDTSDSLQVDIPQNAGYFLRKYPEVTNALNNSDFTFLERHISPKFFLTGSKEKDSH